MCLDSVPARCLVRPGCRNWLLQPPSEAKVLDAHRPRPLNSAAPPIVDEADSCTLWEGTPVSGEA